MQIIVLQNSDKTVSYITPGSATVEELASGLPADSVYSIVDSEDIINLNHGEFADARVYTEKYPHVEIDINRAKDIWKEKIRKARKPILEKLDVEFLRALEESDAVTVREIKDKKQKLRDVTVHKDLIAAKTLTKIREFWPAILN